MCLHSAPKRERKETKGFGICFYEFPQKDVEIHKNKIFRRNIGCLDNFCYDREIVCVLCCAERAENRRMEGKNPWANLNSNN